VSDREGRKGRCPGLISQYDGYVHKICSTHWSTNEPNEALSLTFTTAVPLLAGVLLRGAAQTMPSGESSSTSRDNSTQVKIACAMSAGPTEVAKSARIVDPDTQGNTVVLPEGSNGFTCMPGNPKVVGEPPHVCRRCFVAVVRRRQSP
jgi:hypothetical protein